MMEIGRICTIAEKEFAENIRGRRFLLVLALFLIIAAVGAWQGIQDYTAALERYMQALQVAGTEIMPSIARIPPSVLDVFMRMGEAMSTLGAVLGIAVGFDLISGEKEDHSLKMLLSHPVYRDEVITGKALGGIVSVAFAMAVALGIALALLLISGHVPSTDEAGFILIFGLVSFLYLTCGYAIALAMSVVADRSGKALLYALVVFFFLSSVVPAAMTLAADVIAGEEPEKPTLVDDSDLEKWNAYLEERRDRDKMRNAVISTGNVFSPQLNYAEVSRAVTQPLMYLNMHGDPDEAWSHFDADDLDYAEILGHLWKNIVALLLIPAISLGYAYIRFQRLDLR
ncbi:ABC transporter permease [Methanofollis ethanolicus]|uniref:ABC transporter permease n=1 Tax=Methanofollis ethanolicus TaxID=488124 RepID=UPI00082AD507|nr:ABC transporter permease [Methanofollis ethanolicus]